MTKRTVAFHPALAAPYRAAPGLLSNRAGEVREDRHGPMRCLVNVSGWVVALRPNAARPIVLSDPEWMACPLFNPLVDDSPPPSAATGRPRKGGKPATAVTTQPRG